MFVLNLEMVSFGNELILCSDKGVMYSTNKGLSWFRRRHTDAYWNVFDYVSWILVEPVVFDATN